MYQLRTSYAVDRTQGAPRLRCEAQITDLHHTLVDPRARPMPAKLPDRCQELVRTQPVAIEADSTGLYSVPCAATEPRSGTDPSAYGKKALAGPGRWTQCAPSNCHDDERKISTTNLKSPRSGGSAILPRTLACRTQYQYGRLRAFSAADRVRCLSCQGTCEVEGTPRLVHSLCFSKVQICRRCLAGQRVRFLLADLHSHPAL